MLAARRRLGCAVRHFPRTIRTYASESHSHHGATEANESFGKGSLIAVGAFLGGVLLYQTAPREGEPSYLRDLIGKYMSRVEDWDEITAVHTRALEQAAYDRNLFLNPPNQVKYVDLTFPEGFQSHSRRNIQAGILPNLDHVVEHYKEKHLKEEERKARKLGEQ